MRHSCTRRSNGYLLAMGLALLLFLLAACGNAGTITGGNGPGTTATTTSVTATVSRTNTPGQQCGTVDAMRQVVVPPDQATAQGAENCFWQAYQQCRPATLVYSQSSVDTATIHTFSLQSQNGKCVITDALQSVIAPHAPQPLGTSTCAGLTQLPTGLHFTACGSEGDVLVPAVQGGKTP